MSSASLTATQAAPALRNDLARGIAYMVGSVMLFAAMGVLIKHLAAGYGTAEICFFRQSFALVPTLAVMVARAGWGGTPALMRTKRPLGHLWRALCGNASMVLGFYSIAHLPLADATAVSYAGPLFLTALSVPLLREKVGPRRWAAVLVGFAGVVVMAHPSGALLNEGALAGVAAAGFVSLAMIQIRQLSGTENPATIVFFFSLLGSVLLAPLLAFAWRTPDLADFAMLAGVGLIGGVAQFCLTLAYSWGSPTSLAPFGYLSILFSTAAGFLLWGEVPAWSTVGGAVLVVASGLYIIHREVRRRVVLTAAAPIPRPVA